MNTENWKWFRLSEVFSRLQKCKCSNATELLEDGTDIAYVGAKKNDNGIMQYVQYNSNLVTRGNCIVLIGDGQGSVGYSLYQPNDFIGSTTLIAGYSEYLNSYTALFLVTIIDQDRYRYSFGRKFNLVAINNTKIKLPATANAEDTIVPDWQWMEEFVKNTLLPQLPEKSRQVWEKRYTNQPISTQKIELKVEEWKSFRIGDLFYVELSRGDLKPNECIIGEIPLISSGDTNNGVVMNIRDGDGIAEIFDSNVLTVDMFCKSYYQSKCFYAVSHGRVNILKPKFSNFNQYMAMFLATLIDNERFKFSYGRAVYSNVIDRLAIKLPATTNENGEIVPDWQWIENYIKSLPYSSAI